MKENEKLLMNCFHTFNNMNKIVREYRHSYDFDSNEYTQIESIINNFHSNYKNLSYLKITLDRFYDYLLDVLDFILDNKLKEFQSKDDRYNLNFYTFD